MQDTLGKGKTCKQVFRILKSDIIQMGGFSDVVRGVYSFTTYLN